MSTQLPQYDPLQADMFDDIMTTTFGPITGSGSISMGNTMSSGLYTTITNNTNTISTSPWSSLTSGITTNNTLHVKGKSEFENDVEIKGNITVNGVNLIEALTNIEKRLNILRVNRELEESWQELRELGEKYRALEAEIITREEVWHALKS